MNRVSLVLCIHNHQPVGNLDGVFEHAYRASYLPFLEAMERHPSIRFVVHNTGPLLEWLERNAPEYLDRLGAMAADGRVEILGGAFQEPILPAIPERDARGQIVRMQRYVAGRFGRVPRGLWVAERVWEPGLARVLAQSGVEYVPLDDYEFRLSGLEERDLTGYFITEDQGVPLKVFPISKRLRYLIPFADPEETIEHLRELGKRVDGALAVFGDDGEKFGVWPGTHDHVYGNGWLDRFLEAITANAEWLSTVTFEEAVASSRPAGRAYLPASSYPEMMEWALPTEARREYGRLVQKLKDDGAYEVWGTRVAGGMWRGFATKYDETNFMLSKMRRVSARVADRDPSLADLDGPVAGAREDLWRGQCNCAYWHGVFGGIYLPHLRSAVYEHLIKAERATADAADTGVRVEVLDHDLDGFDEVLLESAELDAYVAPARGGHVFELDLIGPAWNVVATMARHEEPYHELLEHASHGGGHDGTVSIHDAVVAKEAGLADLAVGDRTPRVAAVDHFFEPSCGLEDLLRADANDLLPLTGRRWEHEVVREGQATGVAMRAPLELACPEGARRGTLAKRVLHEGRTLLCDYTIRVDGSTPLAFSSEWNVALLTGLPEYATVSADGVALPSAERAQRLESVGSLSIDDRLRGVRVTLRFSPSAEVFVRPLETASQSEGGFERVYQGLSVFPLWRLAHEQELACSVRFDWEPLKGDA